MVSASFMPEVRKNYCAFCSAAESNKQNSEDRTLDLPTCFRYKHITSMENDFSLVHGKSLPYWFLGQLLWSCLL